MKTLNIPLEDKEYKELDRMRGELSWKEFLFSKAKTQGDQEMLKETSSGSSSKVKRTKGGFRVEK